MKTITGFTSLEDSLTSSSTGRALTAAQGKILKDLIDALGHNGMNNSGIEFNNTSTPPSVSPGILEVNNSIVKKTSVETLNASTDKFRESSTSLSSFCWHAVLSDDLGNNTYALLHGDEAQASQSITGISGTTLTVGTIGSIVDDMIAVVDGTVDKDGVYKVSGLSGSTFAITGAGGSDNTTQGTVTVYYRIASSNVDADIDAFFPSPIFNPTLNGYYLDATGVNTASSDIYRIRGVFYTDTTPDVVEDRVQSYGEGSKLDRVYNAIFESQEQTITSAGALTLTHNLNARPNILQVELICKIADLNYSIGDIVSYRGDTQSGNRGLGTTTDVTDIDIRYASDANVIAITNKTTGNFDNITIASWKLIVRAYT